MRVLDEVERLGLTGVVAVTGGMHWFWASDVTRDYDDPESLPIMVDFLCGGISSSNADEQIGGDGPQTPALIEGFLPASINFARYFDGDRHGYGLITFRPDVAEVEFRSPRSITEPESETEVLARFTLDPLTPGIRLIEAAGWNSTIGLPDALS